MANKKNTHTLAELVAGLEPELKAQFEAAIVAAEKDSEEKQSAALAAQEADLATVHQAAIKTALQHQSDKFSEDLSTALQEQANDHETSAIALRTELDDLKAKHASVTKEIVGSYRADNGRTYKFADGTFKFIFAGKEHSSKAALEDEDLMEELIEMGCGFLIELRDVDESEANKN